MNMYLTKEMLKVRKAEYEERMHRLLLLKQQASAERRADSRPILLSLRWLRISREQRSPRPL